MRTATPPRFNIMAMTVTMGMPPAAITLAFPVITRGMPVPAVPAVTAPAAIPYATSAGSAHSTARTAIIDLDSPVGTVNGHSRNSRRADWRSRFGNRRDGKKSESRRKQCIFHSGSFPGQVFDPEIGRLLAQAVKSLIFTSAYQSRLSPAPVHQRSRPCLAASWSMALRARGRHMGD